MVVSKTAGYVHTCRLVYVFIYLLQAVRSTQCLEVPVIHGGSILVSSEVWCIVLNDTMTTLVLLIGFSI